jgi:predicted RecA/RadA family phage recombinase
VRTFIQEGDSLSLTAPYDVASGGGMMVGSLFAIAKAGALSGSTVVVMTEGVFDITKATGAAWTQGAKVYWDNTAKNVTTTAASNTLIGVAAQAQASGDAIGRVFVTGQVS